LPQEDSEKDDIISSGCMLRVAVARSSSDHFAFAIRYVLPVLWMTSRFHTTALWRVVCIPRRR